jgi:hypothetical protein
MDLVKTKYKQKNVNHITEYIHNYTENTAHTTKYMKQVWNTVRIKSTVNVCF